MDVDEALTFRDWRDHQDPCDVGDALTALADEVARLRVIEAAAEGLLSTALPGNISEAARSVLVRACTPLRIAVRGA